MLSCKSTSMLRGPSFPQSIERWTSDFILIYCPRAECRVSYKFIVQKQTAGFHFHHQAAFLLRKYPATEPTKPPTIWASQSMTSNSMSELRNTATISIQLQARSTSLRLILTTNVNHDSATDMRNWCGSQGQSQHRRPTWFLNMKSDFILRAYHWLSSRVLRDEE